MINDLSERLKWFDFWFKMENYPQHRVFMDVIFNSCRFEKLRIFFNEHSEQCFVPHYESLQLSFWRLESWAGSNLVWYSLLQLKYHISTLRSVHTRGLVLTTNPLNTKWLVRGTYPINSLQKAFWGTSRRDLIQTSLSLWGWYLGLHVLRFCGKTG